MKFSVSMKKNHEFRRLYTKGKSFASPAVVVYFRQTGRDFNQLGITVSTKVGNAVTRNLVRRRIKEIYRLNEDRFSRGLDIVAVARVRAAHTEFSQLERDFLTACRRLNILKPEGGESQ